MANEAEPHTYYRYPALKPVDWGWEVILYFFLGGLAAGSYVIATIVDLFGNGEDQTAARAGRYLALASVAVAPLLLIADLGRRERFLNMLRIVKTRSPMSMGAWGLGAFGLFVGLGALRQAIEDGFGGRHYLAELTLARLPMAFFGLLGSLFSFFVGSYTGVLLSFTNVPLWAKNRLLQGPLFLTSALSSATAGISLVLAIKGNMAPRTQAWLDRLGTLSSLGELGLMAGTLINLGPLARPILRGPYAAPFWLGSVGLGLIVPLMLGRVGIKSPRRLQRERRIAADLAVLLGGLTLRAVMVYAGRESVKNPSDYLAYARSGRRGRGARGG